MGVCYSKNIPPCSESLPPPPTPPTLEERSPSERRRRLSISNYPPQQPALQPAPLVPPSPPSVPSLPSIPSTRNITPSKKAKRRASITGNYCTQQQNEYEPKPAHKQGSFGKHIGVVCHKGLKPESPNQDDFCLLRVDDWDLLAVFDGHGFFGQDASHTVQQHLPSLLLSSLSSLSSTISPLSPVKAIRDAFLSSHAKLEALSRQPSSSLDFSLSGTTATVLCAKTVAGEHKEAWIGYVGDSRAILVRQCPLDPQTGEPLPPTTSNVADIVSTSTMPLNVRYTPKGRIFSIDVTCDHKANNGEEEERIIQSGGEVRRLAGDIPCRVFAKGRNIPGLAMSRALGDEFGHSVGVSSSPDVVNFSLEKGRDLFSVIASDGVWEFLSSISVAEFVYGYGRERSQECAESLASLAWNRWVEEEGDVVDDITIEIVWWAFSGSESA